MHIIRSRPSGTRAAAPVVCVVDAHEGGVQDCYRFICIVAAFWLVSRSVCFGLLVALLRNLRGALVHILAMLAVLVVVVAHRSPTEG